MPRNRKWAVSSLAALISFCTALRTSSAGSRYEETVAVCPAQLAVSNRMQALVLAMIWAMESRAIELTVTMVRLGTLILLAMVAKGKLHRRGLLIAAVSSRWRMISGCRDEPQDG